MADRTGVARRWWEPPQDTRRSYYKHRLVQKVKKPCYQYTSMALCGVVRKNCAASQQAPNISDSLNIV